MENAEELRVSRVYPELFHYTSVRALESIINSDMLWATNYRHLNDSSELEGILPRIERDFQNCLELILTEESQVSKQMRLMCFQTMSSIMHHVLNGVPDNPGVFSHYFVSFSAHDQDGHRNNGTLSQWRGYGELDCVAIVFDTKKLEGLIEQEMQEFGHWPCTLTDVIYDNGEDLASLFPDLGSDLLLLSRALARGDYENFSDIFLRGFVRKLVESASRWKHGGFREENECRIVVGVWPPTLGELMSPIEKKNPKKFKKIHYRTGRNGSIPYVHLFEESGEKLPIDRVIVGPSINQKANLERVHNVIGTKEIPIQTSDIPFVGTARTD